MVAIIGTIFFILLGLAIFGFIMEIVDIAKGKKGSDISSLPEPIRKALGSWF